MEDTNATIEALNDLIMINNDRIAGYEKAVVAIEPADTELLLVFDKMIDESRRIRNALGKEVQVLGGEMAEGSMSTGKIYRAWMAIKATFTGSDRHAILTNCEAAEDAVQKAYNAALEDNQLPQFLRDTINEHKQILEDALDEIKNLRSQFA